MRSSPSIVPEQAERDVYLVLDDLGARLGRAWRETSEEDTDRETLIRYLLEGQYRNPNWIIAFNIREGWVRDATQEIADESPQAHPRGDAGFAAVLPRTPLGSAVATAGR
jgi:hypothetical protein